MFLYGPNFGEYTSDTSTNEIKIRKDTPPDAPWDLLEHDDTAKDWTDTLLRGKAKWMGASPLSAGDFVRVKVRLGKVDYPEATLKVFAH